MNVDQILRAGGGGAGSDYVAANNVLKHHAGGGASVAIVALTDVGGEINIESTAHGRTTGDKVAVQLSSAFPRKAGSGIGTIYTITVIDVDNFTLDSSVFSSAISGVDALSGTPVWELVETTTERWYPGVDSWPIIKAVGGSVTFDTGCLVRPADASLVRAPDPPQNGEEILIGEIWEEGPVTTFIMKTGGGAARLVRAG